MVKEREKMRRRREQQGTVYAKCGAWYVRYSDFRVIDGKLQRKRLAKQLVAVDGITKKQAREKAKDFLATIYKPNLKPENALSVTAFVEQVYFPRIEQRIRPSTLRSYRVIWWKQLKPFCANLWTRDVRTRHVQAILDSMAATARFNINSLQRIKSLLSGVFRLADQQGYYESASPVRETSLPKVRRADETYAYSLEEELTMIDAVPEPASTVLATAAFTGARRGELRGMSWENYRDGELFIAQSIWNGIATEPKNRKSKAAIPIIGRLAGILAAHRARTGNPIAGPIFSNEAGKPMDPNNLLQRVILPALNVCGTCTKQESEHGRANHKYERNKRLPRWHGWHAFRRGLATNLHALGVDDETIQAILRHSNVAVTQACYIKSLPGQSIAAMGKLESALNDTNVTPKQPIPITRAVM
jgi:integrase